MLVRSGYEGKIYKVISALDAVTVGFFMDDISERGDGWDLIDLRVEEFVIDLGVCIPGGWREHLCLTNQGLVFIEEQDYECLVEVNS
jgi:hypothetical protein